MANKMLIDSSHPEETRVVVVRGQKIEEFDFESATRRQLRGNIYLAKVTRVEPSLQAAFVEYGGNRHGFLAFSEIHPDYYQIPVADRQALLEADAKADREYDRDEDRRRSRRPRPRRAEAAEAARDPADTVSAAAVEDLVDPAGEAIADEPAEGVGSLALDEPAPDAPIETTAAPAERDESSDEAPQDTRDEAADDAPHVAGSLESVPVEEEPVIEQIGGDALEEVRERPRHHRRQYKIQEVIKRRQILLVQVVKEERGTKGAALTTYLSLAGRYSVLMPNTGRGGGISRKITSAEDRKRLKDIAQDLEVPDGMGIILRTAGASRTKAEIKRDYEYLMRLWESVRELTLTSSAPALVYEEGSLVKRAIRDLYNKDIDEVLVSGDEGYREAKDFMRMLMPSHAKAVKPYKDPQPLFAKLGVEAQLDAMFSSHVTLKSGGYLVINPTEALVSIDVNSGRATREHNIEDTALKTNLEASEEIARQLRLRDLAGLIVIDFIDMDEKRNNRSVEKKLNDSLKNDRARIQVGRISPFGLLEMSRQRIRTGVLESSSLPCAHCGGTGFVRATPSVALQILRSAEENLIKSATHNLIVRTRTEAAFYILNQKRVHLRELEIRFGVTIAVVVDDTLGGTSVFTIDRGEPAIRVENKAAATGVQIDALPSSEEAVAPDDEEEEDDEELVGEEAGDAVEANGEAAEANGDAGRRRRRRRRRRGRGGEREGAVLSADDAESGDGSDLEEDESLEVSVEGAEPDEPVENVADSSPRSSGEEGERGARRRRGRRGGRGRDREEAASLSGDQDQADTRLDRDAPQFASDERDDQVSVAALDLSDGARPNGALAALSSEEPIELAAHAAEPVVSPAAPAPAEPEPEAEPVAVVLTPPDPDRPKRAGWWSKAKAALGGS
jgi:ribonuclease E